MEDFLFRFTYVFVSTALVLGGFTAGFLALVFFAKGFVQQRAQVRDSILRRHARMYRGWQCFPVQSCNQEHFEAWKKVIVWQETGVLFVKDNRADFYSDVRARTPLRIDLSNGGIEWIGRRYWPNGEFYWFAVDQLGGPYYFTAEAGQWVFSSRQRTKEVYDELVNRGLQATHTFN
ncbi:MAG: hypothetical protein ACOYYS_25170 [Chloroflexota bacterium]